MTALQHKIQGKNKWRKCGWSKGSGISQWTCQWEWRENTRVFFFGDASCNANCRFTQHKKNRLCTYICSLSQKAKALTTTITVFVIRYHLVAASCWAETCIIAPRYLHMHAGDKMDGNEGGPVPTKTYHSYTTTDFWCNTAKNERRA